MSSVKINLPAPLRHCTDGKTVVEVEATTVDGALASVVELYPRLRRHLFTDSGEVRGYVNIYLNDDDIRHLEGEATGVESGDELTIVPSIAGGNDTRVGGDLSPEEVIRYSRHITLPEVGWEGQEKLRAARILLVGAGGLGSPLGLYLAAAGIGTIGVVEFDEVDLSNLQRQVLFGVDDIGRPKLDVAAERIQALNPLVEVVQHPVRLTSENALEIIEPYDLVIDGTDNFPTRYLVNDACVLLGKPYVYGSILRFDGQVSVFGAEGGPCYRCLFREPPPPGLVPSCAEGGVLGVLPGIVGTHQALEAIKLVLGIGEPLIGRLLLLDALTMKWREMRLRRNPNCPVCGDEPTVTELIDYEEFCGLRSAEADEEPASSEITPSELKVRLERGDELQLIDIREPFEWEIANLEELGARLLPLSRLEEWIDELDPEAEIVLKCRSGGRSERLMQQLQERGFKRILNLKGGILAWADEVDPTIQKY